MYIGDRSFYRARIIFVYIFAPLFIFSCIFPLKAGAENQSTTTAATSAATTAAKKTELAAAATTSAVTSASVLSLQVSSLTHPNQDQWYKDMNPVYKWINPAGVDAVQTSIGKDPETLPSVTYSPAISEKTVKDLEDGVWYFKVRARKGGVWGPVTTYTTRIDTVVPVSKSVEFTYDDTTQTIKINTDAEDVTSGIDHYEIFINDNPAKNVPAANFVNGSYGMPFSGNGDNRIRMLTFDGAGNSIEAIGIFHSTGASAPHLDALPAVIYAKDRLLVSGVTDNADTVVNINIMRGNDEPLVLTVKSGEEKSFLALAPLLKDGDYVVWAETGFGSDKQTSERLRTKVTSHLLISIGSYKITAFFAASLLLALVLLVIIIVFYLYRLYRRLYSGAGKNKNNQKISSLMTKRDSKRVLVMLKKRLESHLLILQNTRHARMLTKPEKEIKKDIEADLDEVDSAIAELRGEQPGK